MSKNLRLHRRLALAAVATALPTVALAPLASADTISGWHAPTCATVQSNGNFTVSVDGLQSVKPTSTAVPAPGSANVVTTTTPNTIIGSNDQGYFVSTDAGCTWRQQAAIRGAGTDRLTAAAQGVVWSSFVNRDSLRRVTATGVTEVAGPVADDGIVAVWADPASVNVLRVVLQGGGVYESRNAGATWTKVGAAPVGGLYDADIAPGNVNNVLVGTSGDGAYISHDGGITFTQVAGDDGNNAFTVRFSPYDANLAWVESYDYGRESQGEGARIVSFSADGGNTFYYAFDGTQVHLTNGVPMTPDPTEPYAVLVGFGTYFDGYGTDISRYDVRDRSLVTHHFPFTGIGGMAFSPVDPNVVYVAAENKAHG